MTSRASVSVVIPAFNRAYCIGEAVESVLAQDARAGEVVVVDDGSSDDIEAALKPYGAAVRLIRHERNLGASAARNTGVGAAKGELIAFLDSDDYWKPGKLREQLAHMDRLSVAASCTGFDILPPFGPPAAFRAWRPHPPVLGLGDLVWGCYISPGSTMIVRRDLVERVGGYDPLIRRYEDWDFLLRLVEHAGTEIGFLETSLAVVRPGVERFSELAQRGLDRIREKHLPLIKERDGGLARRLSSGIAFNRAVAYSSEGRRLAAVSELTKSCFLSPVDNWPVRVILGGKLRRSLAGG